MTLLAFDFDGTLAPIENDPSAARLDPDAAEFLADAASTPGMILAVASGRDLDDLHARVADVPAYLIGSHGLEIRSPSGHTILQTEPLGIALDPQICAAAQRSGFRIEKKRHAVALHWRGVRHLDSRHEVVRRFGEWARRNDLDVIEGRCVVEARTPGGGKEAALRWVTSASAAGRVIFAGDDFTDYGALRFASERGMALFVRSSEREGPPDIRSVRSCAELVTVLRDELML